MLIRTAKWNTDTQFNHKYAYGSNPVFTNVEVVGVGSNAKLQLTALSDNSDNISYTDSAKYTLSDNTKLEVAGGVGKLKSVTGVDHNWPFTTPGNYTLNDSTKQEIANGVAKQLGIPYIPYLHTHLNETTGATASDSSGNGRNGTLQNMENADWVAGKLNNCLLFDGINEDVNFGNIANFERTDTFSIEFWMKSTNYITTMAIVGRQTTLGVGYLVYLINTNQLRFILANSAGNRIYVTAAGTANDGSWHHWVITYDGSSNASGIHIYKDNVDLSLTVNQNDLSLSISNNADFTYASRDSSQWFFDGYLDEIVVYEAELTSDDVEYRYNSGTGRERANYYIGATSGYNNIGQAFTAALTSISETATKPANTAITYQMSSDNGVTWKWWNGAAWIAITGGQTDDWYYANETNSISVANTNIGSLANSGTFRFKWFLYSSTGIVTAELDNINIVSPSSYPTDDNLYIDTKDTSQISPAIIFSWLTAVFTYTMPANTNVRVLFSVNGRSSWLGWNGSSWAVVTNNTLRTNATSLANATANFSSLSLGNGTLDVRIFLYSSSSSVTPQIDNIAITSDAGYNTTGSYESTNWYPPDYWDIWIRDIRFSVTTPTGTTAKVYAKFFPVDVIDEKESDYVEYEDKDDINFTDGIFIQWKVEFTSTGENTPSLSYVEIDFYTNLGLATFLDFIKEIEGGKWEIVNNQMIFYKDDNSTEIARFNLYDDDGDPTMTKPYKRERV